jgi:peptidoglycan/LPS O-acetylase OafA/YrhL
MVLPFLLWGIIRWDFRRVFWASVIACMLFRAWFYFQPEPVVRAWSDQLPPRFIEFAWGMLAARWMDENRLPPRIFRGNVGFVIGLGVVLFGRLLMTTEVSRWSGHWAPVPLIFWEPFLTLGYGLLVWNVVTGPSLFSSWLSHPIAQAIGRWSYSLYLWHWWPCWFIATILVKRLGPSLLAQYATLLSLLAVLVPFCWLSYEWLEAPYFNRWRKKTELA